MSNAPYNPGKRHSRTWRGYNRKAPQTPMGDDASKRRSLNRPLIWFYPLVLNNPRPLSSLGFELAGQDGIVKACIDARAADTSVGLQEKRMLCVTISMTKRMKYRFVSGVAYMSEPVSVKDVGTENCHLIPRTRKSDLDSYVMVQRIDNILTWVFLDMFKYNIHPLEKDDIALNRKRFREMYKVLGAGGTLASCTTLYCI